MCGGAYKANPTFAWLLPLDPTFVYFFYGLLLLLIHVSRYGIRVKLLPSIGFFLLFQAWMITTLLWSPIQSLEGLPYFLSRVTLINSLIFMISAIIVAQSEVQVKRFLWMSIILALPLAVEYLLSSNLSQRGFLEDRNYSIIGRMFAVSVIISIGFTLSQSLLSIRWTMCIAMSLLFCYVSLLVGSRQSFLAIGVAFLFMLHFTYSTANHKLLINKPMTIFVMSTLVIGMLASISLDAASSGWTIQRLSRLLEFLSGDVRADDSAEQRFKYLEAGLYYWTDSLRSVLVGDGLFSFSQQYRGVYRTGSHPHNLIVYLLCEFGIVGLLLFINMIACLFVSARRIKYKDSAIRITLLSLTVAFWFRAVIAGDIVDSFVPLVFSALLTAPFRRPLRDIEARDMRHGQKYHIRSGSCRVSGW